MHTRAWALAGVVLVCAGCETSTAGDTFCDLSVLPVSITPNGPVVVDVALEVQAGIIVALATITDPQGSANIDTVTQILRVYADENCSGSPLEVQDDLAGSGVEESFGTVVDSVALPSLFMAIKGAQVWPVGFDVQDHDGHHTIGIVLADVRP